MVSNFFFFFNGKTVLFLIFFFYYDHYEEYTPLQIAVRQGNLQIVKTLLQKRKYTIDINAITIFKLSICHKISNQIFKL